MIRKKMFKERFNKLNKGQIHKASKLMNKQKEFPKIHTKGVKDQLNDQRINNKRATRSDTTWQFLDPLNIWLNLGN